MPTLAVNPNLYGICRQIGPFSKSTTGTAYCRHSKFPSLKKLIKMQTTTNQQTIRKHLLSMLLSINIKMELLCDFLVLQKKNSYFSGGNKNRKVEECLLSMYFAFLQQEPACIFYYKCILSSFCFPQFFRVLTKQEILLYLHDQVRAPTFYQKCRDLQWHISQLESTQRLYVTQLNDLKEVDSR